MVKIMTASGLWSFPIRGSEDDGWLEWEIQVFGLLGREIRTALLRFQKSVLVPGGCGEGCVLMCTEAFG